MLYSMLKTILFLQVFSLKKLHNPLGIDFRLLPVTILSYLLSSLLGSAQCTGHLQIHQLNFQ